MPVACEPAVAQAKGSTYSSLLEHRLRPRPSRTSILVALVLVLTSIAPLLPGTSDASVTAWPSGTPATDADPHPTVAPVGWDWVALADEEGMVDVIVVLASESKDKSHPDIARQKDDLEKRVTSDARATLKRTYSAALTGFSARMPVDQVLTLLEENEPGVRIQPDLIVTATLTESVTQVGADTVWSYVDGQGAAVTGQGIVVAVIDTGIDYTHPDLGGGFGPGFKVIGGYDFHNGDDNPMDDNGHGTHVAGIVAASGGISGVAPGASLLAYKSLGADGSGQMSNVIAAIERAMDPNGDGDLSDRADVISMSLGGPGEIGDAACEAVAEAVEAGIAVVVAAGNHGPAMGSVASPGIAPEAITVGAVDDSGALADFSSRGVIPELLLKPEISAPGVGIVSTVPFANAAHSSVTGYMSMSGTSMATPHVSGGAALLLQMHPGWTPSMVKSALVTNANELQEPLWFAGAGEMWLPDSSASTIFLSQPIVSYGLASGYQTELVVSNGGATAAALLAASDWYSLSADGTPQEAVWTNVSSTSPTSLYLPSMGSAMLSLTVPDPGPGAPEGYYDGEIWITAGSRSVRVPFGFATMSQLNVRVLDQNGNEVFDPNGGVWVYSIPSGSVSVGIRGNVDPAPPASFFLPSGAYSVHAIGHQITYTYSNPYILSSTVTIPRASMVNITLSMAEARQMTLDLETPDGQPIYVKDLRMFCRYVGAERNVSFHLVGSDYSIRGSQVLSLPRYRTVYVSDTAATVGISIAGFAYTPAMWDFMTRNMDHWYEFTSTSSTAFYIESTADLQYLLAWEFPGVSGASPTTLSLEEGEYSVYDTKYDVPGTLENEWGDWGTHLAVGGDASFYVRRDTDTSVNTIFSGMTRTTFVQGVFSELYFPGSLFDGYSERALYVADYDHLIATATASSVYVPDRNFLTPIQGAVEDVVLGSGSIYPSVRTENTDGSFVLFHPLLREDSGTRIGGKSCPSMRLYRDGQLSGVYQLSEHLARPDAVRTIQLSSPGSYTASISCQPLVELYTTVTIDLGFKVPSSDNDPPEIKGLDLDQRFVPGSPLDLRLYAEDAAGAVAAEAWWRTGGSSTWTSLTLTNMVGGGYLGTIPTPSQATSIDIMLKVSDAAGNYITYTAVSASLKQVPVVFELFGQPAEFSYRQADETMLIEGRLTDLYGSPLHPTCAVPLELTVGGTKVGMILDEYVAQGAHYHNGTIRYEWHFDPTLIFSGPNQTAEMDVTFDMGVYQPVTRTIAMNSVYYEGAAPSITLVSPASGSLISPGTIIDLEISDSTQVTAQAYLDGALLGPVTSPWDVPTSSWSDGARELRIVAYDEDDNYASSTFTFEVDGTDPVVTIIMPVEDSVVPLDWYMEFEASDAHLSRVTYSFDGGASRIVNEPYIVPLDELAPGPHIATVEATDSVGNTGTDTVSFEVISSSVVVNLDSPADGSVVRSGTILIFSVLGSGSITCYWIEDGVSRPLEEPWEVSTAGWSEGLHVISVDASNDIGGSYELAVSVTIDDTPPSVVLDSPVNCSYVCLTDVVRFRIADQSFDGVEWSLWGLRYWSGDPEVSVSLECAPADGFFTISIHAYDRAGNEADTSFVFAMDSVAPSVRVMNEPLLGAMMPGTSLDLDVSDVFLTSVQMWWDSAVPSELAPPYIASSADLAPGWHDLHIEASDASGKSSWLNVSYYIDAAAPVVTVDIPDTYVPGESLTVAASATDDHVVSVVELLYELGDGGLGKKAMTLESGRYIAAIPEQELWDGMALSVRAEDAAGNVAESEQVVISAADLPPSEPDDTVPDEAGRVFLSPIMWYLGVASSVMIVVATVMWSQKKKPGGIRDLALEPDRTARHSEMDRGEHALLESPIPEAVQEPRPAASVERQEAPLAADFEARDELVVVPAYVPLDSNLVDREEPQEPVTDIERRQSARYDASVREEFDTSCLDELASVLNERYGNAKPPERPKSSNDPKIVHGLELLRILKEKE